MKKSIFKWLCGFVGFLCFFPSSFGQTTIEKDPLLLKLKSSLPKDWNLNVQGRSLVVEYKGPVWVLPENQINAPSSRETEEELAERIKRYGSLAKSRIIFRCEERWTDQKVLEIKNKNQEIYRKQQLLYEQYGISKMYSSKGMPFGRTPEEEKRIQNYELEYHRLEKQILKLPDYQTSHYSLFLMGEEGVSDEFHRVYPLKVNEEAYKILELFNRVSIIGHQKSPPPNPRPSRAGGFKGKMK